MFDSATATRRQFVAGAAALGAAAALGSKVALASEAADASAAAETVADNGIADGTYTATAGGRNGDVTMTATFKDGKLATLYVNSDESRNIGDAAIEILTNRAIESQCLNFDTVTGATLTSMAFMLDLEDVYTQAGADVKALQEAESGLPVAEAIDEEADVVIVGTGGAALAAAVTALEAGASVVMLDKMDIYGGNTNAGEGTLNAPDPARQEPMGIEDSADKFYEDTYEGGDEKADPELVRILADNSTDAVYWMEGHGLVYNDEVFTAIGGKWQRGHSVKVQKNGQQGGSYYVSCLMSCVERLGGRVYCDAKVEELLTDADGKVCGVKGTRPSSGAEVTVSAKSVVMATGGYAQNAQLAMQYDKRVTESMPSSNVSSSTGDGLPIVQAVGAGLKNMELVQIHPLGDPQNGGVATFVGNWLGVEDYVFVNDEAERFTAEDGRRDEIANAILEQTNDEMWLLVDSTDIDADRADQIADLVATGHSFQADTIEDLADQIGVDPATLVDTIDGYNACIDAGEDTQIDPGKELLGDKVEDGPFYASKRIPTIHYTMGGMAINTDAQVITEDGDPIDNLYGCGECTGGIQGGNRLGGNSFTDLIVFGRIAGASAAANALE
jgi:urocanate reductase